MKLKIFGGALLLLAFAILMVTGIDVGPAGETALITYLGAIPLGGWAAWAAAGVDGLNLSGIERWIAALILIGAGALVISLSGRRVTPFMTEAMGRDLARYDPELAHAAERRRITDRGRSPIVFGVATSAIFFGGLGVWSAVAPLESAAVAPAFVRVESNRLTLDHPDGGTIAQLLVREGDQVVEGQVLMTLDTTDLEAQIKVLKHRRDALRTLRARLLAEQAAADAIDYPEDLITRAETDPELEGMIATQDSLFRAARDAFLGEIEVGEQRITQLDERILGLDAQQASVVEQLAILEEESVDLEDLFERGLTPQSRVLAVRRERARLQGVVGSLTAETAQTKAQIGETRLSIIQLRRNRLAEISEQLRTSYTELLEIDPQLQASEKRLTRAELKSPGGGGVFGLTKFTIGGVIQPGEPILEIVPEDTALVVEARISPIDRDVVNPGMDARVRLTAFSFRETEPVLGTLTRLSLDAIQDERTRESYYSGVVEVSATELAAQELQLQPGMPAEVIIPLSARTPLQYLIEPLLQNWEVALREE